MARPRTTKPKARKTKPKAFTVICKPTGKPPELAAPATTPQEELPDGQEPSRLLRSAVRVYHVEAADKAEAKTRAEAEEDRLAEQTGSEVWEVAEVEPA